jgi:5-bromo-4-chloroindolyl phosphate hydrolysis protein
MKMENLVNVHSKIFEVRGRWVILDRDLAVLYGVTTSALNQAVKRNLKRFPSDFMFQLTDEETEKWKSQIVMTKSVTMGMRRNPNAFTEQGVAMLSGLLNSDVAINANITIMRAFVAMRQYIMTSKQITAELAEIRTKLKLLERNYEDNLEAVNDLSEDMRAEIENLYHAIAELSLKSIEIAKPRNKIGFKV